MTFRPNMTSFVQGFSLKRPLANRSVDGVVADYWSVDAEQGAGGHYLSPDPRIVIILSGNESKIHFKSENGEQYAASKITYIPAGMPLWSVAEEGVELRHLDLHIRRDVLLRVLGQTARQINFNRPIFADNPEVLLIANMLADECMEPKQSDGFVASLMEAMMHALFRPSEACKTIGGLSPSQMRKLVAKVEASPHLTLSNKELADTVGLSEGWFITAFRHTAGTTPHKWQTGLKIARAMQAMTRDPKKALAEIAADFGFADQAHMSRTFKAIVGLPPANWRRTAIMQNLH